MLDRRPVGVYWTVIFDAATLSPCGRRSSCAILEILPCYQISFRRTKCSIDLTSTSIRSCLLSRLKEARYLSLWVTPCSPFFTVSQVRGTAAARHLRLPVKRCRGSTAFPTREFLYVQALHCITAKSRTGT